jgi:hypothetical protein
VNALRGVSGPSQNTRTHPPILDHVRQRAISEVRADDRPNQPWQEAGNETGPGRIEAEEKIEGKADTKGTGGDVQESESLNVHRP